MSAPSEKEKRLCGMFDSFCKTVAQGYQGRVQYLLPICLTDMEVPDLAMTLTIMDGYYLGNTCLTLEMAYLNARLLSRPVAHWLTDIVE